MDEARRQIEQSGFAAMTIRSVAKACAVGVGTVYNYFPSKEILVASFMLDDWKLCIAAIQNTAERAQTLEPVLRVIHEQIRLFMAEYDAANDEVHWTDSNMKGDRVDGYRWGYIQYDAVKSVDWFVEAICTKNRGCTIYRLRDDLYIQ